MIAQRSAAIDNSDSILANILYGEGCPRDLSCDGNVECGTIGNQQAVLDIGQVSPAGFYF